MPEPTREQLDLTMRHWAATGKVEEFTPEGEIVSKEPPPAQAAPVVEPEKPVEAVPPVQEPPAQTTEAAKEEPKDDPLDDIRLEREAEKIERELLEARFKRLESRLGRDAGKAGYYKQEYERLRAELQRPATTNGEADGTDDGEVEEPVRTAPRRVSSNPEVQMLSERVQELHAAEIARAYQDEIATFQRSVPNWDQTKDALTEAVKALEPDYSEDLQSESPKRVRNAIRTLLLEAHGNVRKAEISRLLTERQERRANQMKAMDQAKASATISASGGSPAPKQQEVPLAQRSRAELSKMLDQMARR